MKHALLALLVLLSCSASAQLPEAYTENIKKAEAFYDAKQYKQSADAYSKAFEANGWKGSPNDRYNAGCSWAQAGNADSAFYQLERIASKGLYTDIGHLTIDVDLLSLHNDKRWEPLCAMVKANKDKAEANLDKPLAHMLDTIFTTDQMGRMQLEPIQAKYGAESKEAKELWKIIAATDSINVIKICNLLDTRGWLGPDVVGPQGSQAIFLVIQHADIAIQEKYLPMMRDAVKKHNAQPSALALLEDRVALREGKKQVYGSQIGMEKGEYYLSPLEDPDNVDKRRAEVGLGPLADYVQHWNLKWDVEAYKKQLPEIEKREKAMRKRDK